MARPVGFNKLTEADEERLYLLVEECGEVLQVCGKIGRQGPDSVNPYDDANNSNTDLLEKELGHVLAAIHMMHQAGDINIASVLKEMQKKLDGVRLWLHHQPECVTEYKYGSSTLVWTPG